MKRLFEIQQKLKAPKGERNNLGKYNYRTAEGILQAVKPLLKEQNLVLILSDKICDGGFGKEDDGTGTREWSRNFVEAKATLYDDEGQIVAESKGYAELQLQKKGMDVAQITGSCSSYARKYAMCGLFAIDGSKDIDTEEYQREMANFKPQAPSVSTIKAQLKTSGLEKHLDSFLKEFGVEKLEDLTDEQRNDFGNKLAITIRKMAKEEK